MTNTKDVILKLKQVKVDKGLSLDKILILMEKNGQFLSKSTLSRVFAKGSEDKSFRYEETLRPIANALLDINTIEDYDDPDTQAYKSILKLKMEIIAERERQIEELKEELTEQKLKYHERLANETEKFQKSLAFTKTQIELKDKRIDQLMNANDRLSITNDRLINQLMDCPLRKDCK